MESDRSLFSLHKTKTYLLIFFIAIGLTIYMMSMGVAQSVSYDYATQRNSTAYGQRSSLSSSSAIAPSTSTSVPSPLSKPPSPPSHKKVQVLLVTKGRSGSSFTSALLSSSPRVFYTFEPLHVLNKLLANTKTKDVFIERALGLLQSYLNCDFMTVSANDLNLNFLTRTAVGSKFFRCEHKQGIGFNHIQCLINFVKECRSKDTSFLKVIRLPLMWVQDLMKMMPKLKIIYLVRDPRAVLSSQSHNFGSNGFGGKLGIRNESAAQFCTELREDLIEFSKLSSVFPGRLRLARYENGAKEPVEYAKSIYSFLGLAFTNATMNFISYSQSGNTKDQNDAYGVRRKNPTKIIDKWRTSEGAYRSAKTIDRFCGDVYSKFGYKAVTSQKEVNSLDKPLFVDGVEFKKLRMKLEVVR